MKQKKSIPVKKEETEKSQEKYEVKEIYPIITVTGVTMYPLAPKKEDFRILDIAHALSLMVRANGHFNTFYSVAQHSLACSLEGEARGYSKRIQLALLLHDASEAYISDLTRPVKEGVPYYKEIEANLEKTIFEAFGLFAFSKEEAKMVREIDDDMMFYEFDHLHDGGGPKGEYHLRREHLLGFRNMKEVEDEFIERFHILTNMKGENEELD